MDAEEWIDRFVFTTTGFLWDLDMILVMRVFGEKKKIDLFFNY